MATNCGTIRLVPGVRGDNGDDGDPGAPGTNAYTLLNADFTMPAELGTAVASVISSEWMPLGAIMYLQNAGYVEVVATPTAQSATLRNLKVTATGAYASNVAPGTIIASGSRITASGPQGPSGSSAAAGAPTTAEYWLKTADAALPSGIALDSIGNGLILSVGGVPSVQPIGNGDTEVPYVDDPTGLTNNELLRATASGIRSEDASTMRGLLGLGTMAVQNSNNVNITGGTITGITGLTSGFPRYIAIYENQQPSGTEGGNLTLGSWVTVPINTEVSDAGGLGTLAANAITLVSGTYRVRWSCPAYLVNNVQSRLFNVTTASVLAYGSSEYADTNTGGSSVRSTGEFRFTLGASQAVRLEIRSVATNATSGLGKASGLGGTEIYGRIVFEFEST